MNIPFTAMHFSVYEGTKKWLLHIDSGDEEAEDRLSVQVVAGGLAGGAAAAVTTPLDVVKTRLQTEGVHSPRRYGTTAVVRGFVTRQQAAWHSTCVAALLFRGNCWAAGVQLVSLAG